MSKKYKVSKSEQKKVTTTRVICLVLAALMALAGLGTIIGVVVTMF